MADIIPYPGKPEEDPFRETSDWDPAAPLPLWRELKIERLHKELIDKAVELLKAYGDDDRLIVMNELSPPFQNYGVVVAAKRHFLAPIGKFPEDRHLQPYLGND